MAGKLSVGKLRVTLTVTWEVEDLEHYLANSLREAAKLTDKQIADNEVGPEDVVTWGDVTYGKCEVVKEKKSR